MGGLVAGPVMSKSSTEENKFRRNLIEHSRSKAISISSKSKAIYGGSTGKAAEAQAEAAA